MAIPLLAVVAALAACPAPKPAIARPAVLGPVFPTPRTYVYTSGTRRKDGAAVVAGYLKEGMAQAYQDWWETVMGSGRYKGVPRASTSHTVITFTAWKGGEHGRVDIYATCENRMTAVITYFAKE